MMVNAHADRLREHFPEINTFGQHTLLYPGLSAPTVTPLDLLATRRPSPMT